MVALIGSVPTGRAVMRAASDTVKPVMLELGGKNALIAYPDADVDEVSGAVIARHELHLVRAVLRLDQPRVHSREDLRRRARAREGEDRLFQARHPDRSGHHHGGDHLQGAVRSRDELHRVGQAEGARLIAGGGPPNDPKLAKRLLRRADHVRRRDHADAHRQARKSSAPCSASSNGPTKQKC